LRPQTDVRPSLLDDGVCALTVLHDLVKIVAQSVRQFRYFSARISVDFHFAKGFSQFVDQFGRNP
jgi:hypothetical protein